MSRLLVVPLAALALVAAAPAAAAPPPPLDLQVQGGEGWHPGNRFRLDWRNPETTGAPIAAVRYRVRAPDGAPVGEEVRIPAPETKVGELQVIGPSGAYTVEVWLEDAAGEEGLPATANLRFDTSVPPNASPVPLIGWVGRNSFPLTIEVEPPEGPFSISGIRGYAVSVDDSPFGEPCAGWVCTDAETDLRGGVGDVFHVVPELPEGTHYAHVLTVSGAGIRAGAAGHTTIRVDTSYPQTRLAGVPAGWTNHAVTLTARATDAGSGMDGGTPGPSPFTAIRVDGGVPSIVPGDTASAVIADSGVHLVEHYARDAAGNVADGATMNGRPNPRPATALLRIDRDPPSVRFRDWQDPRDPELIEALVTDKLSGPSREHGSIQVRRAGGEDPFRPLATRIVGDRLLARWDSAGVAPGEYAFRAVAADAAGNTAGSGRRGDGSAMVLPSPLKAATSLEGGLGSARLQESTARLGRRVVFGGRLTTPAGTPLPGQHVLVVERFDQGSPVARSATAVRTGRDGSFRLRLGSGPSREISAVFPGSPSLSATRTRTARLLVRASVRLRVSSAVARVGGPPVVFSGRVAAPRGAIPAEGKTVALQFRLPGLGWSEFRTVRTDRRGRFRYRYRFADDDSRGVRFQFRAQLPPQSGWPFEPVASRPVSVRGK